MFFSDCLKLVLKVFRYPQKFVAAALIGADIDGGHYMPSPSRRYDSQTPSSARVNTVLPSTDTVRTAVSCDVDAICLACDQLKQHCAGAGGGTKWSCVVHVMTQLHVPIVITRALKPQLSDLARQGRVSVLLIVLAVLGADHEALIPGATLCILLRMHLHPQSQMMQPQ